MRFRQMKRTMKMRDWKDEWVGEVEGQEKLLMPWKKERRKAGRGKAFDLSWRGTQSGVGVVQWPPTRAQVSWGPRYYAMLRPGRVFCLFFFRPGALQGWRLPLNPVSFRTQLLRHRTLTKYPLPTMPTTLFMSVLIASSFYFIFSAFTLSFLWILCLLSLHKMTVQFGKWAETSRVQMQRVSLLLISFKLNLNALSDKGQWH